MLTYFRSLDSFSGFSGRLRQASSVEPMNGWKTENLSRRTSGIYLAPDILDAVGVTHCPWVTTENEEVDISILPGAGGV